MFDSGLDFSGWGAAEWLMVAAGAYVLFSVFSTTKRGYGQARRTYKRLRSTRGRRPRGVEIVREPSITEQRRMGVGGPF